MKPGGIVKCPSCRGWTRTLDGNWVVPHFPAGKHRVCSGSSRRAKGKVYHEAEFAVFSQQMRERGLHDAVSIAKSALTPDDLPCENKP